MVWEIFSSLLKQKKFAPLFWTQFFGAFNDNFIKNALVILVTFKTQEVMGLPSSQIVALAGGIFILPFFLFSALAGQLAEKFDKAKIMRVVKWTELGIMFIATYGLLSHHFSLLLVVLFLMGLHSTFFGPVKYSILPQHLTEDEIIEGNGLIEAGTFLAILLGTIFGGSLIEGEHGPLIVSIGLIACAVIGLVSSYQVPSAPPAVPDLPLGFNPIPPTLLIFKFAQETRVVFLSILGISWFWFFGAAFLSLFAPMCKDLFHGEPLLVTTFLAVFSVGVASGSLLCAKLSKNHLELGLVPFGSFGLSIFGIIFFFLTQSLALPPADVSPLEFINNPQGFMILINLFFIAVSGGFFIVPLYALMQEKSEITHRSRIIAANNVLNALFMVVSSLLLAVFLHFKISIPVIILILSLMNLSASFYIYFLMPEFFLRFVVWIFAQLIYRVRVHGQENIPKQGPAFLICNHVSFIDWLIIACGVYRPARFVMHKDYFEGLFLGPLFRQAKVIPIASAKEDPTMLEAAYNQIRHELKMGNLVCIFPEGSITRDGKMSPFRPGILKMLAETPVPVVPMALTNLWGSFFSRKDANFLDKRPRKFWSRIDLNIGEPIDPKDVSLEVLEKAVLELHKTPS